jgi:hypothetical protein
MTSDRITIIALLSAQLGATMVGIWRASAWVQRIEDRLSWLEKFCDQLGPLVRPRRGPRDRP